MPQNHPTPTTPASAFRWPGLRDAAFIGLSALLPYLLAGILLAA